MKISCDTAAVCGLFCGTCPEFIEGRCGGCLSDTCVCDCHNGFRECAQAHAATRCYECELFPCTKLRDFSAKHIVNGICHHKNVISDLTAMKENGVERWVKEQTEAHTCWRCGKLIAWYARDCECKEKGKQ